MSKPFFHGEKLCKGCRRMDYTVDSRPEKREDKWFCFGVTTAEGRKTYDIPHFDILRLCVKHPPLQKLPVRNIFQLNMKRQEVEYLIKGLRKLL